MLCVLPDAGDVHQGVERPHRPLGLRHQVGQRAQLSQVGNDGVAVRRRGRLLAVHRADPRARLGQPGGGGPADPVGGTGHEGSAPFAHQLPSSLPRCSAAASSRGPWPQGTIAPSGTFA